MIEAVRRVSAFEAPERFRHALETADADRHDNPTRLRLLAVVEDEAESVTVPLNFLDEPVFCRRHESVLEGKAVFAERLEADRLGFAVGDRSLGREAGERIEVTGVREIRREGVGFQQHAPRHVSQPTVHREAKNSSPDTCPRQMRRQREAIRPRADDRRFSTPESPHVPVRKF
jgi:hypothetical protein